MIRTATRADEAAASALLVLAFAADPMTRWSWPDPQAYLAHFPVAVRAFGGKAFDQGSAHLAEGGAALWLPPGSGPDEEALGSLLERTAPARIPPRRRAARRMPTGWARPSRATVIPAKPIDVP